ncbi:helix-turn-helix domain-containing protein [bacterium]|nr:helix-turn-helix domain-containing protein [bacterium]
MAKSKIPNIYQLPQDIIERIETTLAVYYDKTRIHSIVLDNQGEVVSDSGTLWICDGFYCKHTVKCKEEHRLVLRESYRLGGPFVHLCHKDFVIWGVSITRDNTILGGVLSGFVLFEQHQNLLQEYLFEFPGINRKGMLISSQTVNSASQMLFTLFKKNNLFDIDLFKKLENRAHIQREIAEKIIEKKSKEEYSRHVIYQKQNNLIQALQFLEVEKIRSGLNDVLSEIFLEGINNISLLKFRMLELFVLISRTMLEIGGNIEEYYHLTSQYTKNTEDLDDIYSFSLWLTAILNDFIATVTTTRKKLGTINRAIDYIKNNLDKKLVLSEVALLAAMSESRFSIAFKMETGLSFSEFVNITRVENAKKLILEKKLTFVEITTKLGFFDQSYFTKIFKKYTGKTPRQFSTL